MSHPVEESRTLEASIAAPGLILVVDDDPAIHDLLGVWLAEAGYETRMCRDGRELRAALADSLPCAVCLDIGLPDDDGMALLERIRESHPDLPVIMLTRDSTVESVVRAMQAGAFDYLSKPVDPARLQTTLRNAVDKYRTAMKLRGLEREAGVRDYSEIVGRSPAMSRLFHQLDRLTASEISVLIQGESGTGKELVARAIHDHGSRSNRPFVAVNCAAIPETLQESELFGHERGSFTGADRRRIGRFEEADGGTLFLDEIAELSLPLQAKLLRVLQERSFRRIGGGQDLESDFRVIAATHGDLPQAIREGRFREDLFFRVAVFELELPPLRDREGDVEMLAELFLRQQAEDLDKPVPELSAEAGAAIRMYPWTGNVRELHNAIQRAFVVCNGRQVEVGDLPLRVRQDLPGNGEIDMPAIPDRSSIQTLEEIERDAILAAIRQADGNLSEVCRQLAIGRTTLYRKLKKYGVRG